MRPAPPPRHGEWLALAPRCTLKRLETAALYDARADALFQLDEEALQFLASGPSRAAAACSPDTTAVMDFCLAEGLIVPVDAPVATAVPAAAPTTPTLRYLLVHVTDRCTLRCRHCFIGTQTGVDLPLADVIRLADEFVALQGLRFIVSGGEPMMHRHFWTLNERLPDYPFRAILLTNGTLLDREAARALRFDEVQVSLDGPEDAHDLLRGTGSFRRAIAALRHLADAGVPTSVASVVFAGNLERFDEFEVILREFELRGWSIDVPCPAGAMAANPALIPDTARAAALMSRSFGGGYYGSTGGWACGAHLAAVMADGTIDKCGYFTHLRSGHLREGLATVWRRLPRWRLEELACRCSHLDECCGGCRFRAQANGGLLGPDPVQCHRRGVPVGGDRQGP